MSPTMSRARTRRQMLLGTLATFGALATACSSARVVTPADGAERSGGERA
ncbi:MAG: hypothetical protein JWO86_8008, partial [Myxococcaceae bacterium]|nr:hypothetical protein [Myxococcaceae bacterium]